MPRRKEPYLGIGSPYQAPHATGPASPLVTRRVSHTVVNGARWRVSAEGGAETIGGKPSDFLYNATRRRVAAVVRSFPELAALQDKDQLVSDLTVAIGATLSSGLDLLVQGADSKPTRWDNANLLRSVAAAMAGHGLAVSVSEYELRGGEGAKQSLFLLLVQEIAQAGGISLPRDVKGLAIRAKIPKLSTSRRKAGRC